MRPTVTYLSAAVQQIPALEKDDQSMEDKQAENEPIILSDMEICDEANSNDIDGNQPQSEVANDSNGDGVEAHGNQQADGDQQADDNQQAEAKQAAHDNQQAEAKQAAHDNEQAEAKQPDEVKQANDALPGDYGKDESDDSMGGNEAAGVRNGIYADLLSGRVESERKAWRRNHPHGTFLRSAEGNLCRWFGGIYGRPGTPLQGGLYRFIMVLPYNYPLAPPTVQWAQQLYHPNIYPDRFFEGIDYLQPAKWTATRTFKNIVGDLADLLHEPRTERHYTANMDAMKAYKQNQAYYARKLRLQAREFKDTQ